MRRPARNSVSGRANSSKKCSQRRSAASPRGEVAVRIRRLVDSVIAIAVRRWLKSSSNRTFVVYPVCVIAFELALHRATRGTWGTFAAHGLMPWGFVLLAWGYLQYRLVGRYRLRIGGGGGGGEGGARGGRGAGGGASSACVASA